MSSTTQSASAANTPTSDIEGGAPRRQLGAPLSSRSTKRSFVRPAAQTAARRSVRRGDPPRKPIVPALRCVRTNPARVLRATQGRGTRRTRRLPHCRSISSIRAAATGPRADPGPAISAADRMPRPGHRLNRRQGTGSRHRARERRRRSHPARKARDRMAQLGSRAAVLRLATLAPDRATRGGAPRVATAPARRDL
jgi:hypothetical protein